MWGKGAFAVGVAAVAAHGAPQAPALPQEVVAFDNTKITRSCRLILPPRALVDEDNNGVIHIEGDDLVVDLDGKMLVGASATAPLDSLAGIGIRVTGKRVTLRNGAVSGYRVAIEGVNCDGCVISDFLCQHNYSERLKSTPHAEDLSDWLFPHENDADQWATKHGAAISIRSSKNIEISRVQVRQGQNGILLSRVEDSRVFDCDASFLSGWGLALWRSSGNVVARNAFDFCVRGYSHEKYNRGQDSAGILCFEQCCRNTFMLNSATHCGDGFFSFAGREALGEAPPPPPAAATDAPPFVTRRGCNDNLIAFNDFSDAAAHGIETTFSFGNRLLCNRLDRDAICGVWGGYSHGLLIHGNLLRANGSPGAAEGGGINIEHGVECRIERNTFSSNSVGVSLWWDEDPSLTSGPWSLANGSACTGNSVVNNAFTDDATALRLRDALRTVWSGNALKGVRVDIDADEASKGSLVETSGPEAAFDLSKILEQRDALSRPSMPVAINGTMVETARTQLAGRAAIAMGEFGPHDFVAPMAIQTGSSSNLHQWRLLGPRKILFLQAKKGTGDLRTDMDPEANTATVTTESSGQLSDYALEIFWGRGEGESTIVTGTILNCNWRVQVFPLPDLGAPPVPPSHEAFDAAARDGRVVFVEAISFPFGGGGPEAVQLMERGDAATALGSDRFGLKASTTLTLPQGDWIVETNSDDGIRVTLDDRVIIDRWTHHGPTVDRARVHVESPRESSLVVEYFELAGHAVLDVKIVGAGAEK